MSSFFSAERRDARGKKIGEALTAKSIGNGLMKAGNAMGHGGWEVTKFVFVLLLLFFVLIVLAAVVL